MLNLRFCYFLVLFVSLSAINARVPGLADDCVTARSLVFSGPDSVSKFYRIPALAVTDDGSIIAVADRRIDSNKDLPGRIDVVCRRSTDGGQTWGPVITVAANDEGGGYGDPGLAVDRRSGDLVCVFTHGNGLWESTPDDHAYIYVSRSSDGGLTWSKPENITENLFDWEGKAPVKAVSAFATSGHILTAADGTLWFCLVARVSDKKWSKLHIYPVCSRDGGKTWTINPTPVDEDADESKMAQLRDGSLLMSIRNRRKGWRKFSRSTDGGRSWSPVEYSTTLPDPACNGDILTLHDGRLLHSINDSHTDRRDITIFSSDDNARTWERRYVVNNSPGAYSAMVLLPDGQLGILSEEHSTWGGLRLWFTRVDMNKW